MKESVRELTPEKIQTIEERVIGVLNKTYAYEDAMNTTDDYGGAFRKHREVQTQRLINLTNSLKEFKYYQNVSLDNVTELEGKVKYLTDMELALDALVLKAKTKDFLKGKYPGFHESEANAFHSMRSEYLPQPHYDNCKKLKLLHEEIIDQRQKGKFPEETILKHKELLVESYTDLENYILILDKNSPQFKELNLRYKEFHLAKNLGQVGKGQSHDEAYQELVQTWRNEFTNKKSRELEKDGKDSSFSLPRQYASPITLRVNGSPKKSFPLGDAPKPEGSAYAFDADAAATFILFMYAGRRILNRLAKAMTPVGETSKRQQTWSQEAEAKPGTEPTGSNIGPKVRDLGRK